MAIVDAAIAVGTAVGWEGISAGAAGMIGGGLLGAGTGALYSGITGDGNILNSALNGALIGGSLGGIGGAVGATGMSGSLFGTPQAGMFSGAGSAMFPATGVVAPTTAAAGAPVLGGIVAPTTAETVAPAATALPNVSGSLASSTAGYGPGWSAAGFEGGPGAAANAAWNAGQTAPGLMDGSMGTAAKWGAGLMAANSLINNSNKKYGTLSPSQTTSLPLQYQSNFGTYQPLDTTVMRPMGPASGYSGTPYGSPGYSGSRVGYATGGIADANNGATPAMTPPGGPVEQMSRDNALGQNQMFPQSQLQSSAFSSPTNTPMGSNLIAAAGDTNVDPYSGAEKFAVGGPVQNMYNPNTHLFSPPQQQEASQDPLSNLITQLAISQGGGGSGSAGSAANGGVGAGAGPDAGFGGVGNASASADGTDDGAGASDGGSDGGGDGGGGGGGEAAGGLMHVYAIGGGITNAPSLGSYAAGGNPRLLKGPGDGMSDNIPAQIGTNQPARLADGEFVVPADVVSHLGNGSTDAGAKRLHAMMNNVRKARTGRKTQGKQIKADKFLPK